MQSSTLSTLVRMIVLFTVPYLCVHILTLALYFSVLYCHDVILGNQVAMVYSDFNEFTAFGC